MFVRSPVKTLTEAWETRLPVFQVLTGPRQVGKTTIAEQVMEALPFPSVYATADSPLPPGPEWIETNWRLAQVDFVVTRGTETWAIEIKSGRAGKLSGMEHFRRRYPEAKKLIAGTGGIPLDQSF